MNITELVVTPMVSPLAIAGVVAVMVVAAVMRVVRSGPMSILQWLPRVMIVFLLATMLLRPSVPSETALVQATNADVFLVVDTTASIAATDWAGTEQRLTGVRADVRSLVEQLAGARFSVISFDSVASLRVPLTTDAAAVITAIDVARPEVSGHSAGSSVGLAAPMLEAELNRAALEAPQRARAVYYFGDGEQTAPTAPESFGASAPLIGGGAVFGYGTVAGATIPINAGRDEQSPGSILDPATNTPAISAIDTSTLATLADQLAVPLLVRSAGSTIDAGEMHLSALSSDGSVDRDAVEELYWIPAIGVLVLLLLEVGRFVVAGIRSYPKRQRS